MIALLLAAITLPVQIVCTNCNGVGYFEIDCPACKGAGLVKAPRITDVNRQNRERALKQAFGGDMIPCRECLRGLSSKGKKGTGKKKVTCKVCHGNKKIRAK